MNWRSVQAFLTIKLVDKVIEAAVMYYCQRMPEEMARFDWVVDAIEHERLQFLPLRDFFHRNQFVHFCVLTMRIISPRFSTGIVGLILLPLPRFL
jgi:hypothetical protein